MKERPVLTRPRGTSLAVAERTHYAREPGKQAGGCCDNPGRAYAVRTQGAGAEAIYLPSFLPKVEATRRM